MRRRVVSAEACRDFGREVGATLRGGDVVTLEGALGSGKTVFTKGVAEGVGVVEQIESPSYAIIHEYGAPIFFYHVDLYRIGGRRELELLDVRACFCDSAVVVIEWPALIMGEVPRGSHIAVRLVVERDGSRTITVGSRGGAAVDA